MSDNNILTCPDCGEPMKFEEGHERCNLGEMEAVYPMFKDISESMYKKHKLPKLSLKSSFSLFLADYKAKMRM